MEECYSFFSSKYSENTLNVFIQPLHERKQHFWSVQHLIYCTSLLFKRFLSYKNIAKKATVSKLQWLTESIRPNMRSEKGQRWQRCSPLFQAQRGRKLAMRATAAVEPMQVLAKTWSGIADDGFSCQRAAPKPSWLGLPSTPACLLIPRPTCHRMGQAQPLTYQQNMPAVHTHSNLHSH